MDRHIASAAAVQRETAPTEPVRRPPMLASSELLQGGRIVEIRHNGEVYRLQATRLGKLILTK